MKILGLILACATSAMFAVTACGGEDAPMTDGAAEWGYAGSSGPAHWASLCQEFRACGDGKQQSPVDIARYTKGDSGPISFSYGSNATAVRNDGKFVHVDYPPGNTLTIGQRIFELESAHLHSPSEHWIDGVSFAAELHLVHGDADGNLAAVGLLFEMGGPTPIVQAILDAAPDAGYELTVDIELNAAGYVPSGSGYYRYEGSKTTPPCYEPVEWYVMQELKSISPEQVENLRKLSGGSNNRPIQPTGSRMMTLNSAR